MEKITQEYNHLNLLQLMALQQGMPFLGSEAYLMDQSFPVPKDNMINMMQFNHQYNLMMMQQNFVNQFPQPFPNLLFTQNLICNTPRNHNPYDLQQINPHLDPRNQKHTPKISTLPTNNTQKLQKEVIVIDSDEESTEKKILQLNHQKQETPVSDNKIKYLPVQKSKIAKKQQILCKNCNRPIIQKKNSQICQKCLLAQELKQKCLIKSEQQEKKQKMIKMRHLRLQKRFSKLKKIHQERNIQTQKWENQLKLLNNYKIQVGQFHQVEIPNFGLDQNQQLQIKSRLQIIKQNLLSPEDLLEQQEKSFKIKIKNSLGCNSQESSNNSINTEVAFQQTHQSNQKKFSQRILQKKYSLQKV